MPIVSQGEDLAPPHDEELRFKAAPLCVSIAYFFCFGSTVIPGPPLFSLTVQLLASFPCRVEFIKDIQ